MYKTTIFTIKIRLVYHRKIQNYSMLCSESCICTYTLYPQDHWPLNIYNFYEKEKNVNLKLFRRICQMHMKFGVTEK